MSISVDGTTVGDVCAFTELCTTIGIPRDTPVRARISVTGALRRISAVTETDGALEVLPSFADERAEQ